MKNDSVKQYHLILRIHIYVTRMSTHNFQVSDFSLFNFTTITKEKKQIIVE